MNRDELYVIYGRSIEQMTRELLLAADLAAMIADRSLLVGIKPNLVDCAPAEFGSTTHREIVATVIEYLQERGFSNIVMLESSWVGSDTAQSIQTCGYDRLSEKYGVPFWNMDQERGISKNCAGMEISICEKALLVDFLINVPVLKGHCQTFMTCALKNMKGLIPPSEKRRFHRMGLHDPIGHLAAGIHQDFILVDSICGDLTSEDGGNPIWRHCMVAGLDPVLVDTYACRVVGTPQDRVCYIGIAESLGVGSADLSRAVIREKMLSMEDSSNGRIPDDREDGWRSVSAEVSMEVPRFLRKGDQRDIVPGEGFRRVCRLSEKAEEVDSCSACYAALIPALENLEERGLLEKLQTKVCIGQGWRGKKGELGVGNCTAKFAHTCNGCPPSYDEMAAFLADYILKKE